MDTSSIVPKEAKSLSACVSCRLVMQNKQWDDHLTCPNCHKETDTTSRFSGITSFIHPKSSWVAKFMDSRKNIPGVYAVHVFGESEENDYDQADNEDYIDDNDYSQN